MKRLCPLVALIALTAIRTACAQGTAFTYQGRLSDHGNPANGNYDLRFTLFDAASGGTTIGGPLTNTLTGVSNGNFTVALDFGAGPFDGSARWLEVGARSNSVPTVFTTLTPRQPLTPTPYAIRAGNFSGSVADSQLSANVARLNGNQTFSGVVSFSNPSNTLAANFFGNAVNLSNFPPYSIPIWQAAPTPVLAYNTYYDDPNNAIPGTITATNLLAIAQRMQTNGMLAAGWKWIWIDDGWQQTTRDGSGNLAPNPVKFPAGMASFVSSIHALGFKVGIYSSFGNHASRTCFFYPGTDFSTVQNDMSLFASWGIDGVKMDACGDNYNGPDIAAQPPRFRAAANSILNTGRPMVLDFTVESGFAIWPIYWEVPYEINVWPASGTFDGISGFSNMVWAASYVANSPVTFNSAQMIGPGHYMNWGNLAPGSVGAADLQAYFTMLGITSCASFAGDWTTSGSLLRYFTNLEVMAVNQDPAATCGTMVYSNSLAEVWLKPLGSRTSGISALALVNLASTDQTITVNWSLLGLPTNALLSIRDLWAQNTLGTNFSGAWTNTVPANSVQLFKTWANSYPPQSSGLYIGTFSGSGAGLTNTPANFGTNFSGYNSIDVLSPSYGTNPLVVSGAVTLPGVNETYYYSAAASTAEGTVVWTNRTGNTTNILWYDSPGSAGWVISTNAYDSGSQEGVVYYENSGITPPVTNLYGVKTWFFFTGGAADFAETGLAVNGPISSYATNPVVTLPQLQVSITNLTAGAGAFVSGIPINTFAISRTNENNASDLNTMVGLLPSGLHVGRFAWTNSMNKIATHQPLRVMFYGDGWALDSTLIGVFYNLTNLLPIAGACNVATFANNYAAPGYFYANPVNARLSSNDNNTPDTNWLAIYWTLTNSASRLQLVPTSMNIPSDIYQLDYLAAPDGGTFKIQTNINGGAFSDLPGFTAVSSFSPTLIGRSLTWTSPSPATVTVQIVATTGGTNRIVNLDNYNSTVTNGVILQVYAHQGVSWSEVISVRTNAQNPILSSWRPDLILVPTSDWEDDSLELPAINANSSAWNNSADLVVCGSWQKDPAVEITAASSRINLRKACVNLNRSYFDAFNLFPSWTESVARGYSTGGSFSHLTAVGYAGYAQLLWDWLALVEYAYPPGGSPAASTSIYSPPYTVTNSTDSTLGFGAGLLRWDTNYLYISVETNRWKRVGLSSW